MLNTVAIALYSLNGDEYIFQMWWNMLWNIMIIRYEELYFHCLSWLNSLVDKFQNHLQLNECLYISIIYVSQILFRHFMRYEALFCTREIAEMSHTCVLDNYLILGGDVSPEQRSFSAEVLLLCGQLCASRLKWTEWLPEIIGWAER